jgi:peptidoglycan L-alanyl-D-glutamate endopeptidase CwlK
MLSKSSITKLNECHTDLQRLILVAAEYIDLVVVCGFRGEAEQNKAFAEKKSKLKWPNGKHNRLPSDAVDIAPLKRSSIDWNDRLLYYFTIGYIQAVADNLGIKIRLGADFNMDKDLHNDSFVDLPHIELVRR